jgi:hypothetical protein
MWTARDVTNRLRRELNHETLIVALEEGRGRWAVYELVRGWSAPRPVGFSLSDDGEVLPGTSVIRTSTVYPKLIYVHEDPRTGEYLPLDPHVLLDALLGRDRWRDRKLGSKVLMRLRENRERREQDFRDYCDDRADEAMYHARKWCEATGM